MLTINCQDRKSLILSYCQDKRVLDIGACNHGIDPEKDKELFLHGALCQKAKEVVGIDIDLDAVIYHQGKGYNIHHGNAEELPVLNFQPFDCVVAGDVIEHLSNPGLFLDGAFHKLLPGGHLIASVPNAWSFTRLKQLQKGIDDYHWTHDEHVAWYSKATIQAFFIRHGYEIESIHFADCFNSDRLVKRMANFLRFPWAFRPEFSEAVVIVGRRPILSAGLQME